MYRKDQKTVKYTLPASNMRVVLMSIERRNHTRLSIRRDTKLKEKAIFYALKNLFRLGAIMKSLDREGRKVYYVDGQIIDGGNTWARVNSVFGLTATGSDNTK